MTNLTTEAIRPQTGSRTASGPGWVCYACRFDLQLDSMSRSPKLELQSPRRRAFGRGSAV
jgi:hypothetical protein